MASHVSFIDYDAINNMLIVTYTEVSMNRALVCVLLLACLLFFCLFLLLLLFCVFFCLFFLLAFFGCVFFCFVFFCVP